MPPLCTVIASRREEQTQVTWRLVPVPCRPLQPHPCLVRTLRPTLELVSHAVQDLYSTVLLCVRMLIATLHSVPTY
jgi:hypothetical protein